MTASTLPHPHVARDSSLDFSYTSVTDHELEALVAAWPEASRCTGARLTACAQVTARSLAYLRDAMPHLQMLDLRRCGQLDAAALAVVGQMTSLRMLMLSDCRQLTDYDVQPLAGLTRLEHLELVNCAALTDGALDIVADMQQLRALLLGGCTGLADGGVEQLVHLPQLADLRLVKCYGVTDRGVTAIAQLPALVHLNLGFCRHITDRALEALAWCRTLEDLRLLGCDRITDVGVAALGRLTALQALSLTGCPLVSDAGLAALEGLVELRNLRLLGCHRVGDRGAASVAHLAQLEQLNMGECYGLTDAGAGYLARLSGLTALGLAAMLDSVLLVSYAALLVAYDTTPGTLTIVLSVLRMGLLCLLRRQMQRATATELTLRGKELGACVESFGFPETVRAFGIESALIERYTNRLNLRLNASVALKKTAAINQRLAQLFDGASMALILWMGGQAVITDQMTPGVFAGFVTLQGLLRAPLASLVEAYTQWVYARGILARLDDVLQTAVEASGHQAIDTVTGAVSLTDVSFRHGPEAPWVVRNVTLHIAPGELVAIVGPSGAGKSTLLRLLLGFLEPTEGVIRVDGIALSDLDCYAWRRQVGSLLPEPCFFNDTVRANLSLYNDSLPMHVLAEAARRACIHETIQSLPAGYDTRLGERGARLSGGQRQRLALARAFIGKPRLLLLDEPTAALDPDTEMQVMRNLLQMDCTRIVITHRLDTTRVADRIIVFDQGQIVQDGRFDDLSQRPGLFQDMLGALCHDYSDVS